MSFRIRITHKCLVAGAVADRGAIVECETVDALSLVQAGRGELVDKGQSADLTAANQKQVAALLRAADPHGAVFRSQQIEAAMQGGPWRPIHQPALLQ